MPSDERTERLVERLRKIAEDEGCLFADDADSVCIKERRDPSEWCAGCAAEHAAALLTERTGEREPPKSCGGWLDDDEARKEGSDAEV